MAQDFGTPVTPIQEFPPVQPKKSNKTIWIIVAVVVVILCCCCIIAAITIINNAGTIGNFINTFNSVSPGGGY